MTTTETKPVELSPERLAYLNRCALEHEARIAFSLAIRSKRASMPVDVIHSDRCKCGPCEAGSIFVTAAYRDLCDAEQAAEKARVALISKPCAGCASESRVAEEHSCNDVSKWERVTA